MYFKYLIIACIPLFTTNLITNSFKYSYSISNFIINCLINIVIINIIYTIIFYKTEEFKYFKNIVVNILKKLRAVEN